MNWITLNFGRYSMTLAEAMEKWGVTPLVVIVSALFLAVIAIALVTFVGLWTYNDAKERTDDPALWTLLVIFIPMPIGLMVYLLLGRNKTGESTGRYLKPLIATVVVFMINLSVVIASSIYLVTLVAR